MRWLRSDASLLLNDLDEDDEENDVGAFREDIEGEGDGLKIFLAALINR